MDYVLYWLDHSGWLAPLQHAWIWASVTAVLALLSIFGIAALARYYDSDAEESSRSSTHA